MMLLCNFGQLVIMVFYINKDYGFYIEMILAKFTKYYEFLKPYWKIHMQKNIIIFWIFVGNLYKNYVQYIVNLIFFNYVFLKIVTNVIISLIVDVFNMFLFLYPT